MVWITEAQPTTTAAATVASTTTTTTAAAAVGSTTNSISLSSLNSIDGNSIGSALLASTALPLTQIAFATSATSATAAQSGSILASTASFSGALEKSLQFGFAEVTRRVVTQVAKNGIKRVSTIALALVVTKSSMGGNLLSSSTAPVPTSNLLSIASTPYSAVFFSINHNDRIFTIDNQFNETVTCIDNNNFSFNFNKSITCQIDANNNGIKCNTTNFVTEINCGVRSKSALTINSLFQQFQKFQVH
ncbi:hypothetical protein DDB_G0268484 [Dictyostelium discoideum AX4]|uniref:Uncharacterized protein n=1 Tax=Dictyostelium discoideum TaxID=44689 RepID=Q55GL5_DICDI|nr:hypothetical protein DDB_G0268484 [Dictyostelium discoideum AX4]EAL73695.1 hypothetical protein DDB_G0268484 [Dictyostelium discoideum AX4]|eukprot:XP_647169.1 hypothetical protein DDB_G0268484 [Dictyostelium discoideum AX4]